MFESCRPDSRKLLGNKGLSAFLGRWAGRAETRWRYAGATPGQFTGLDRLTPPGEGK